MARNSKNKKIARKNKKLRYRKGGPARLDMRKGGRVALQRGGKRPLREEERRIQEAAAPVDPSRLPQQQPLATQPLQPLEVRQMPIPEGGPKVALNPNLKHPPALDRKQQELMGTRPFKRASSRN